MCSGHHDVRRRGIAVCSAGAEQHRLDGLRQRNGRGGRRLSAHTHVVHGPGGLPEDSEYEHGVVPSSTALDAVDLVAQVAAAIPVPNSTLCKDAPSWAAFESLVDEAADLLVEALGHAASPLLRRLAASPISAGPVCHLLLERALDRLDCD